AGAFRLLRFALEVARVLVAAPSRPRAFELAAAAPGGHTLTRDRRERDDDAGDHRPHDRVAAWNVPAETVDRPHDVAQPVAEPLQHAVQRPRHGAAAEAPLAQDPPGFAPRVERR